jgi:hypothetical protein
MVSTNYTNLFTPASKLCKYLDLFNQTRTGHKDVEPQQEYKRTTGTANTVKSFAVSRFSEPTAAEH